MIELTLEKQFQIKQFQQTVDQMDEYQAKEALKVLHESFVVYQTITQQLIVDSWDVKKSEIPNDVF